MLMAEESTDGDPDANYFPISNTLKIMPWHKDELAQY